MLAWREIQKQNFTSVKDLLSFLQLDETPFLKNSSFPLNLPKRLAEKIEKGNRNDPILLQFVPLKEEDQRDLDFIEDPLSEKEFQKSSKLLQKYHSRALLLMTGSCAMNCRFCFRRHFPYDKQEKGFEKELSYIKNDPTLTEIILSGGDPLSLSDQVLEKVMDEISSITHIKRIRFHTRFPLGIPERITTEFLAMLEKSSKQIIFILHSNHPREFDDDVIASLKKIQRLGIPILTHTVLLQGVNDNTMTLKALFEKLVDHGFLPYYLNSLDKVEGATHFEVAEEKGKIILEELTATLSGYAVPKFAKEIAGETSKRRIY